MLADRIAKPSKVGQVEVERKTRESGHACLRLIFFELVREKALCHHSFTPLVMVWFVQTEPKPCRYRAPVGFLLFWWWIRERRVTRQPAPH